MADARTILVIDDDPDFRTFCRTILETEGYSVLTAATGEAGIAMAEKDKPDLIILDLMMERIDSGYSVAKRLGPAIPIIMSSSATNESDMMFDPKHLPIRAMLNKPVNAKALIDKVRDILNG